MHSFKSDEFKIRVLTKDDAEEYNALLRYAFQVTEADLAETGWKDDEIKQSKFPVLERADVLGCFNIIDKKEELVAQFAVYPLDMNIYGERYEVGFVTSVCTYPEYTGHGLMKKLMRKSLTRMRDSNKSFALLYPYSIPLYRGLGWEIISNKMTYVIKDRQIPTKLKEPGYVRRVQWDDEQFKKLHTHFAAKTHGCLYRNNLAWEEYFRWDEDDTMVAIYYSEDDEPCGFLSVRAQCPFSKSMTNVPLFHGRSSSSISKLKQPLGPSGSQLYCEINCATSMILPMAYGLIVSFISLSSSSKAIGSL